MNRLQITTGAIRDFSGAKELIAQEQAVQQANLGSPAAVTVSTGGYFVAADAAQMLLYSQDELDNMSAAEMADALQQEGPSWIDCRIDKDERVLPMIPGGGDIRDIIME